MPSPLSHAAMGYVIYRISKPYIKVRSPVWIFPVLLILEIGLSLLPDIDSVAGILFGDFGRFHNQATHSLFVGCMVALIIASLISLKQRSFAWAWLIVVFAAYGLHVLMDYFTLGRGVMLFWPLSTQRYISPFPLFYGLHWSDGLLHAKHLVTLGTELIFVLVLLIGLYFFGPRKPFTFQKTSEQCADRS